MLSNLNNEAIFKKAFTDKIVFKAFVRDILGVETDFNQIETNNPSVFSQLDILNIPHKFDLWAESDDKSSFVVIQRITNDYKLGQFLYYCPILIQQLQKNSNQNVYVIVVKTDPYIISDKGGKMLSDEVLLYDMNPKTLRGEVRNLSNYQLVCVNPNYQDADTPKNISDWLDFIYQSIQQLKRPVINIQNDGIRIASELINVNNITDDERLLIAQENIGNSLLSNKNIEVTNLQTDDTKEKDIAIKMLGLDMNIEIISQITGLGVDVIKSLNNNQNQSEKFNAPNHNKIEESNDDILDINKLSEDSVEDYLYHTQVESIEVTNNNQTEEINNNNSYAEDDDWSAFLNGAKSQDEAPSSSPNDSLYLELGNADTPTYSYTESELVLSTSPMDVKKKVDFEDESVLVEHIISNISDIQINTENNFRDPGDDKDGWIYLYNYLTLSNMAGVSSLVHDIAQDYKINAEQRIGELKYVLGCVLRVKNYTFYREASVSIVDGIDVIINLMVNYINRRIENIAKTLL